jgi:tRNA dimethylallyltransferase
MKRVIILLGPTGVGKTGIAIMLAEYLKTEIISADSMQIYRRMDIGTAKPTPEERASVKHHMIDIVEPDEPFSTGKYIEMVVPVIEDLHRKGKIPVVVGGTGLYIKAMTRGIFSGPSADWTLREQLLSMEAEEKGSLYDALKKLDPVAAGKITPNDRRRIVRALEVCLSSSSSISVMQKKLTRPLPYEFIKIGITRDRKELYRMIEERVDQMVRLGLIDEVKGVIDSIEETKQRRGNMRPTGTADYPLPSLQAIGYKEIAVFLRGEIPLDDAVKLIKRATKRYAKRQFTWFRKEDDIHWVDITGLNDSREALRRIDSVLEGLPATR